MCIQECCLQTLTLSKCIITCMHHGSKWALKIQFLKQDRILFTSRIQSKTFLMPVLRPGHKLHNCILQTDDWEDYILSVEVKNSCNLNSQQICMSFYFPRQLQFFFFLIKVNNLLVSLLNECNLPLFSFYALTAN